MRDCYILEFKTSPLHDSVYFIELASSITQMFAPYPEAAYEGTRAEMEEFRATIISRYSAFADNTQLQPFDEQALQLRQIDDWHAEIVRDYLLAVGIETDGVIAYRGGWWAHCHDGSWFEGLAFSWGYITKRIDDDPTNQEIAEKLARREIWNGGEPERVFAFVRSFNHQRDEDGI